MGAKICSKSKNSSSNFKKNKNNIEKTEFNIGGLSIIDKEVIISRRNSKLSNKNEEAIFLDLVDMNKLLQYYK